ncbi:hypothetical protein ACTMTF_48410 [Nonomuraea sp. ZG12]|uniref:hypothetical protein n=1 Tax=Nonomuraea sp. ZG12 TaxID=3452207 RepID=UPI003F8C222C
MVEQLPDLDRRETARQQAGQVPLDRVVQRDLALGDELQDDGDPRGSFSPSRVTRAVSRRGISREASMA